MKKVIILGAIVATISSNNASGMLLRYIKPVSPQQRLIKTRQLQIKRLIPQQRTICILPPNAVKPKRFKTRKDSLKYTEKKNEIIKKLTEQNKNLIEQNLKLKKQLRNIEDDRREEERKKEETKRENDWLHRASLGMKVYC